MNFCTFPALASLGSVAFNDLGPDGGAAMAEGLKNNTTLTSLEYAAQF